VLRNTQDKKKAAEQRTRGVTNAFQSQVISNGTLSRLAYIG